MVLDVREPPFLENSRTPEEVKARCCSLCTSPCSALNCSAMLACEAVRGGSVRCWGGEAAHCRAGQYSAWTLIKGSPELRKGLIIIHSYSVFMCLQRFAALSWLAYPPCLPATHILCCRSVVLPACCHFKRGSFSGLPCQPPTQGRPCAPLPACVCLCLQSSVLVIMPSAALKCRSCVKEQLGPDGRMVRGVALVAVVVWVVGGCLPYMQTYMQTYQHA